MTKKQYSYSEGKSKCEECGQAYFVKETILRLAQDADNPLFVKEVIQYFANTYGKGIEMTEFVCVKCVQQRWDEVLDDNSVQYDSRGHAILSDNDEFFGRREDEEGGSVVTKQGTQKKVAAAPAAGEVTALEPFAVQMVKGDYKGKAGKVVGTVVKMYWKGFRVELSTGKVIDVQETSFEKK